MRRTVQGGAALAAAMAMLAAAPAPMAAAQEPAAAEVEGALFILRARGSRNWRVECVLNQDDGDITQPRARGRGSRSSGSLVGRDVVSGACAVSPGGYGPLTLTMVDRDGAFACPFGEVAEGAECMAAFEGDETISIDVALR